jgi:hypothetical protein
MESSIPDFAPLDANFIMEQTNDMESSPPHNCDVLMQFSLSNTKLSPKPNYNTEIALPVLYPKVKPISAIF